MMSFNFYFKKTQEKSRDVVKVIFNGETSKSFQYKQKLLNWDTENRSDRGCTESQNKVKQ